jgi:hypothetical protein
LHCCKLGHFCYDKRENVIETWIKKATLTGFGLHKAQSIKIVTGIFGVVGSNIKKTAKKIYVLCAFAPRG